MGITDLLLNIFWIFVYIVFLIVFLGGVLFAVSRILRKKREKKEQYNLTFMEIKLSEDNEVEIEAAEQMFSGLVGIKKSFWSALFTGQHRISFEIVSRKNGISFYVIVPDSLVGLVEKQINGAYPDAEIDLIDPNEVWDRGNYTSVRELKLAGPAHYPIKVYEDMGNDPLNALTSVMSKLGEEEALAVQFVISPAGASWLNRGQKFIGRTRAVENNPEKQSSVDPSFLEGVQNKISKPGFNVVIRLISLSENKVSADSHLNNITSAFEQFADARYNKFKVKKLKRSKKIVDNFIFRRLSIVNISIPVLEILIYKNASTLNVEELATIFHFPNNEIKTPKINWLKARRASAPSNVPQEGLYLGTSTFRGVDTKIHIKKEDRRRHSYIIGQTGTGKSQFLMYMALQDIKNGEGLCIIDPHGSDIDELLEKIPPERADDVVLFDASDTKRPLGLNILEADTEEQKNMIINAFIALLYKLYDPNRQGIIGPQLERSVRNVMLTAMADENSTLVDVLRLLIDPEYVKKFLPKINDPLVKRYWQDEMAQTSDFHKSEKMGYFVSKFDRFVTERVMRNILGQPKSAIDFSKVMAEKKILLVDLSKGKIGEENSNFLGLILVPKILAAAMGRHNLLGKEEFPDFYLYVDEFQNFATPDFATILSEARKYRLNLTVANQFVAQLSDDIKDAVFGNVGTMAAFRVGPDDAEYLETQFEPFTKNDLMNNSVGNYYLRLLIDGQPSKPFSVNLSWDEITAEKKYKGIADKIRKLSREKYGAPVSEIEKYIDQRIGLGNAKQKGESKDSKQAIKDLF